MLCGAVVRSQGSKGRSWSTWCSRTSRTYWRKWSSRRVWWGRRYRSSRCWTCWAWCQWTIWTTRITWRSWTSRYSFICHIYPSRRPPLNVSLMWRALSFSLIVLFTSLSVWRFCSWFWTTHESMAIAAGPLLIWGIRSVRHYILRESVVDDAKCIVVTRVCVPVCLSVCLCVCPLNVSLMWRALSFSLIVLFTSLSVWRFFSWFWTAHESMAIAAGPVLIWGIRSVRHYILRES